MIKTTRDILDLNPTLTSIAKDPDVSGSAKIKIADLADILNKRAQIFENERQNLFTKFGEQDKDTIHIKAEYLSDFNKEMEIMFDVQIEIPDILFTLEELRLDKSKVTGLDIITLRKHSLLK